MEKHFLTVGRRPSSRARRKSNPGFEELVQLEATTCVISSTEMPASAIAERTAEMASARPSTRKRSDMASIEGAVGWLRMVHQKKLSLSGF